MNPELIRSQEESLRVGAEGVNVSLTSMDPIEVGWNGITGALEAAHQLSTQLAEGTAPNEKPHPSSSPVQHTIHSLAGLIQRVPYSRL